MFTLVSFERGVATAPPRPWRERIVELGGLAA
jgi:hypothetical protein